MFTGTMDPSFRTRSVSKLRACPSGGDVPPDRRDPADPVFAADGGRYGGTVLGLAICMRLTEAMGGEIGLNSAPGAGSTFWFAIPLPVAEAPAGNPEPLVTRLLAGLRVLVVDDNATNRLVLESQLTAWRQRPDAVADAGTALDRSRTAAATGQPYDIAVLDMCMPEMGGLELAHEISADPDLRRIRLMMLTSTSQVAKSDLAAAGIRERLTKPVRGSELHDGLVRLMEGTSQAVPAPAAASAALPGTCPPGAGSWWWRTTK